MNSYDCVIIGGGIAGLTSALYAARGGLKTLVIESTQYGGQIVNSLDVENYPGFLSISGYDLISNIKEQVKKYNVEFLEEEVTDLKKNKVITNQREIEFKTAIIASGLKRRTLGLEDDYIGKGVSYCATCDGAFFKNKKVAVVGGGNTALEDVLYLSNIASTVYLIHRRDTFRADASVISKITKKDNVEFVLNKQIKSINGDGVLESITLDDDTVLNLDGLFIAIGFSSEVNYLHDLIELDEDGFIKSDNTCTNIPNIFVAGDVRTKEVRQLITAASDGAIAATNCINYININS
mgnify:CR=1 FL=1